MATKDPQAKRMSPKLLDKAKTSLTAITQLTNYDPQRYYFDG